MTETLAQLSSPSWSDDAKVVTGKHRDKMLSTELPDPTFGDQIWNFDALVYRTNAAKFEFNFGQLFPNPVWNLTARELAMQRLNAPVQPVQRHRRATPTSAQTIVRALYDLKALSEFMGLNGVERLADVDQEFLDAYARHLQYDEEADPHRCSVKVGVVYWLYEARSYLSQDRIEFLPWGGKSAFSVFNVKNPTENKTPRIPEDVMDPLLRWSIKYIHGFSDDIIALNLINEFSYTRRKDNYGCANEAVLNDKVARALSYFKRIQEELRTRRSAGRSPNDFYPRMLSTTSAKVRDPAEAEGIDLLRVASSLPRLVEGFEKPWRPPLEDRNDLLLECRNLVAACYVVSAYLSGMRDSEVQAMTSRPVHVLHDESGQLVRIYAVSKQFKGRQSEGFERTWVVLEPVAKAIEIMEELGLIERAEAATENIFVAPHFTRSGRSANLRGRIVDYINHFIEHINGVLVPWHESPPEDRIEIEEFQPIKTRMFRRTIAWYIANRPFGIVAGMLQYGHASTQMFEGYAGSSASGFRQEVEKERAVARLADIVEMYTDHNAGNKPAGPMAEALTAEFEYIRETIQDFPGVVAVEPGRRAKMVRDLSTNYYPGQLADCFYEPSRAKCLEKTGNFLHDEPIRGLCDPNCENACWRPKHLPMWNASVADIDLLLEQNNRLSPIQRDILRAKKAEYGAIAAAIREAGADGAA